MTGRTGGRGWAYAGAVLGGAVSVAANVAHSFVPPPGEVAWTPQPGAVVGAVFWPVALFVAVEILARIAWPAGLPWMVLRYLGLLPVTAVAAVVSYRHLSGLLAFYREDRLTAVIGPLAVDGLMVMASSALVATAARRAAQQADTEPDSRPDAESDAGADTRPVSEPDTATDARPDSEPVTEQAAKPDARPSRSRRSARTGTAAAVARLHRQHPDMGPAEIGRRLRVSDRTVRRHLAALREREHTTPTDASAPAAA